MSQLSLRERARSAEESLFLESVGDLWKNGPYMGPRGYGPLPFAARKISPANETACRYCQRECHNYGPLSSAISSPAARRTPMVIFLRRYNVILREPRVLPCSAADRFQFVAERRGPDLWHPLEIASRDPVRAVSLASVI